MEGLIHVLLADDHQVIRQGLSLLLQMEPDIRIVGEAGDGETAIRLARELHPDVVVMDCRMPSLSGIDATRQITTCGGTSKVVGLSGVDPGPGHPQGNDGEQADYADESEQQHQPSLRSRTPDHR
jgi:DNA-binding NtrC family response regulator